MKTQDSIFHRMQETEVKAKETEEVKADIKALGKSINISTRQHRCWWLCSSDRTILCALLVQVYVYDHLIASTL